MRCAPSMRFYYVEPLLLPFWRRWKRLTGQRSWLPPSSFVTMPLKEFAARLERDCGLPNIVYPSEGPEYYYAQSALSNGMLRDINLYVPPLSCLGAPGAAGAPLVPQLDSILPTRILLEIGLSQCLHQQIC